MTAKSDMFRVSFHSWDVVSRIVRCHSSKACRLAQNSVSTSSSLSAAAPVVPCILGALPFPTRRPTFLVAWLLPWPHWSPLTAADSAALPSPLSKFDAETQPDVLPSNHQATIATLAHTFVTGERASEGERPRRTFPQPILNSGNPKPLTALGLNKLCRCL